MEPIEFIDLKAQRRRLGARLDAAILDVVDEGRFIQGPQVAALERALEMFCGVRHAITCGNGTDALGLTLMALGLRPGDAVLVPAFTFAATAEAVAWLGATPVFVEIEAATYTVDPGGLAAGLAAARMAGLRPRALIAVDLFGQPADYGPLEAFCADHHLALICDAAQSLGAAYGERKVGAIGTATTTSFFPSKPLGCYGDGGAIFTDDDDLAARLRSLHVHGRGVDKYDNVRIGMNSRLDTIQAAILLEKLAVFPDEIAMRQAAAEHYTAGLSGAMTLPALRSGSTSVWAQFTVRVKAARREAFMAGLKARGIPTLIYYPTPLHRQTAYRGYPVAGNGLPISDAAAAEVVALPMHPDLTIQMQEAIIAAVREELT
ncbi:DegT/DnrJ/EryC1/StrS family aminotransferase [Methylobacterium sp. A49B]